jgi:hypothetical protein
MKRSFVLLAVAVAMAMPLAVSRPALASKGCAWSIVEPHLKNLPGFQVTAKRTGDYGLIAILTREEKPKHLLIAIHKADAMLVTFQMVRDLEGAGVQMSQELSDQLTKAYDALGNDAAVDACEELKLPAQIESKKAYDALIALFNETFDLVEKPKGEVAEEEAADYVLVAVILAVVAAVALVVWLARRRKPVAKPVGEAPEGGPGAPAEPPAESPAEQAAEAEAAPAEEKKPEA